ncbi:MAG: hypothetical protein ACE5DR_07855 [Thermodesulfobacteriota bacterium]
MIAVNIMSIELTALFSDDGPRRAGLLHEVRDCELPVFDSCGRLMGVLEKHRPLEAIENGHGETGAGRGLTAGGICRRADFLFAGPGAASRELREMPGEKSGSLYIVDNGRRLLGRVEKADLRRRESLCREGLCDA